MPGGSYLKLRVPADPRNSAFQESPGIRNKGFLETHWVPGVTRNKTLPESGSQQENRVSGFPGDCGNPELWVKQWSHPKIPEFRNQPALQFPGFTGFPDLPELQVLGITRKYRFPDSPKTLGSRSHKELRVIRITKKSEIPDLGTRKSAFQKPPGKPSSWRLPELRFPRVARKSGFTE